MYEMLLRSLILGWLLCQLTDRALAQEPPPSDDRSAPAQEGATPPPIETPRTDSGAEPVGPTAPPLAAEPDATAPPTPEQAPPDALTQPQAPDDANMPSYGARARKSRLAPGEIARFGTASRVNAPLEEIPASVSVVDEQALREKGSLNTEQALTLVPGLNAAFRYGGFALLRIRGFRASLLVDGLRDARMSVIAEVPLGGLFDLERIEVLRGPSSVLYGYGAVGGALNIIRRQPSRTPLYTLDFGIGAPEAQLYHLGAQGPLGEYFSYRVDVGRQTRTDFRGALSERNQVSATVLFTPARSHNLSLRFGFALDHTNVDTGIPMIEDPDRPGTWKLPPYARLAARYNSRNDYLDYQRLSFEGNYRWDLSRVTYLQARASYVSDGYGYLSAETLTYVPPTSTMGASVDRAYYGFTRGWKPFIAQLELHTEVFTGPLRHQLVLGYELSLFQGKSALGNTGDVSLGSVDFTHPEDNAVFARLLRRTAAQYFRHDSHSVYGFDHVHVFDSLIATGGVRFDTVQNAVELRTVDPETNLRVRREDENGPARSSERALTGQFGLVYTPHDIVTLYGAWSTGFVPVFQWPDGSKGRELEPERSQQLEAGMRLRVRAAGHTLDFDGAVFAIEKRNLLISRGMDMYDQAGKVNGRGFDFSLHYAAPSVVSVDLSYVMTRARFDEFSSTDPVSGELRSLAGKQPEFVPTHSGQAWLRFALTQMIGFGLGGRFIGDQYADHANRVPMHGYALLDLAAWIQAERFAFNVSVRNVLDEHDYFTSAINTWAVNPQITPGPGREIFASLRMTL